jgi:hypothetical protein
VVVVASAAVVEHRRALLSPQLGLQACLKHQEVVVVKVVMLVLAALVVAVAAVVVVGGGGKVVAVVAVAAVEHRQALSSLQPGLQERLRHQKVVVLPGMWKREQLRWW